MNRKKKDIPPKSLEQLLEETETKKKTLLKILEKITKENPKDQTPNWFLETAFMVLLWAIEAQYLLTKHTILLIFKFKTNEPNLL